MHHLNPLPRAFTPRFGSAENRTAAPDLRAGDNGGMSMANQNTLTKASVVDYIYEKTDKNRAEIKELVESILDIMKESIKKDHAMLISGFGKFEAYDKKARKGRNPQTNDTITLPARKVVVFRLSRKFRAELNG